jgi:hypothetical protein
MLSKEQITWNQEKFKELNEKHNIFTESLSNFLGEGFFLAPASTMLSLHNACPGGLLDHLIKTCRYMIHLNRALPQSLQVAEASVYKVAFLSEIGKTFLYTPCQSKWHRENQGKMYEFKEDMTHMRVGERSAYYALRNGVELSEEEYQAIVNIDKPLDDKQAKWYGSTLSQLLRQATELAIMVEKHEAEAVTIE